MAILAVVFLLILLPFSVNAQVTDTSIILNSATLKSEASSPNKATHVLLPSPSSTLNTKSSGVLVAPDSSIGGPRVTVMHNPSKALWLSAILPGAGQVYNKQAWKIPIIYGALAGVGYVVWNNYQKMSLFKEEYLYRVNHNGATQLAGYENYPTTNIYNMYQSYNKNFQLFVFIEIGVYGLNLLDAYVFGHLFDFEMDDNLSMSLYPTLQYNPHSVIAPAMGLTFQF